MKKYERYCPEHPDYPKTLLKLLDPPSFTASGPIADTKAVAIVGSRDALHDPAVFAYELAFELASVGVVIVSGGATGIDAAAHRGALDAGGATWVVCPTGKDRVSPKEHAELFDQVAASEHGRLIWPFADDEGASTPNYRARNRILVALAQAVVVIQARYASGSRNACSWANEMNRQLWIVPALPWGIYEGPFSGSADVLLNDRTAHPLGNRAQLFTALDLPRGRLPGRPAPPPESPSLLFLPRHPDPLLTVSLSPDETAVVSALSLRPQHCEILAEKAGLSIGPANTALLTLSLKDVVVEGPEAFFRRKMAG